MNNTILITGATSGIGRQLALDYANSEWNVIACGRNQDVLAELEAVSSKIHTLQFDVTNYEETQQALSNLPFTPNTWVFNAGDCEYMDEGVVDAKLMARVMNVNVVGVANCVEGCQVHLERGHRIVIVGSIASEVALPRAEAYGASKAAVSYFARTLAVDLKKKGINVVTVFPGFVETPLTDKNDFEMPMIISTQQASDSIRKQLAANKTYIYFPARFTSILRFISLLPYSWQARLTAKLVS
ncbi:SDR family oxidoreductase [Vibrio alginolyticus]|uniref:KR domain-containing protein n=5 Tax=Vibrio harveyi group TaxID=717610 RepID=A0A7Y0MT56_VIBAL|nr:MULTISPECIES: SDR family oxidoreductase [Vibrio]EEZ81891.1 short chain dehydrogenase [Vibrio alginolyticus 40B]QCO85597.1 SDR family oxidoreductase [Vibrio neocaledonicus]GAK14964.1 oxidoreductase [Vibrio sp. JCM 19053]AGV16004.1 short chain dehydrogenase [Vibrio alginolyticus NBRC 15630 = ATCC 17749]AVF65180.1 KR domain-containing protein [Vibrio alginolyticus]